MDRLKMSFCLLSMLLVVPAIAAADCREPTPLLYMGLTDNGNLMGDCGLFAPPGDFVYVSLVIQTVPTAKGKVRFKLADPPAGLLVLNETWPPHTGNRVTGMEIDLSCSTEPYIVLGSFLLIPTAMMACTTWQVADVEVEDCAGDPVLLSARPSSIGSGDCTTCSFQDCMGLGPYNLSPPDGLTSVALNTAFTWAGGGSGPLNYCYIRIGTTPDCSNAQVIQVPCTGDHSIVLDFLQPGTTYYWQAQWAYRGDGCAFGSGGNSTVHSFTTAGVVGTQAATWGKVKSMYRD